MLGQLNFPALWPYWPELLAGLWVTIQLTVLATVGGVGLGILGAALRSGKASWASRLWGLYVEIIRNTPFVVQLFFYRIRPAQSGAEADGGRGGAAGDAD
ncbi:ABC transporter permease subunit [Pantoea tagorei]